MPDDRLKFYSDSGYSEHTARIHFTRDALAYGYRFFALGAKVYECIPPVTHEVEVSYRETEIEVDPRTGDFVPWVIVRPGTLTPLVDNGQLVVFPDPALARAEALRNAGEAMRLEDFFKQRAAKEKSRIILPS